MKRIIFAVAILLFPLVLSAEVPLKINFQGRFSSTGTLPTVEFRVVNSDSSDTKLENWSESTAPFTTNGVVSLVLGDQTAIPADIFNSTDTSRYLWVKVGSNDPTRHELISVPFAYQASYANELAGGTTVQGTLNVSGLITSQAVEPASDSTYDLGASGNEWAGLHVDTMTVRQSAHLALDGGKVGIGTTTPAVDLHVLAPSGDFADMRVETLDSVKNVSLELHTPAQKWRIYNKNNGGDQFQVYDDTADTARMVIETDGQIGMGTDSPVTTLHIKSASNTQADLRLETPGATKNALIEFKTPDRIYQVGNGNTIGDKFYISDATADAVRLVVDSSGKVGIGKEGPSYPLHMGSGAHVTTGGAWTNASSRLLKENFIDLQSHDILNRINRLKIQRWNYKVESSTITHIGPFAEDFQELFGVGDGKGEALTSLDTTGVALLGIQALTKRIEDLEAEISALKNKVSDLESR